MSPYVLPFTSPYVPLTPPSGVEEISEDPVASPAGPLAGATTESIEQPMEEKRRIAKQASKANNFVK